MSINSAGSLVITQCDKDRTQCIDHSICLRDADSLLSSAPQLKFHSQRAACAIAGPEWRAVDQHTMVLDPWRLTCKPQPPPPEFSQFSVRDVHHTPLLFASRPNLTSSYQLPPALISVDDTRFVITQDHRTCARDVASETSASALCSLSPCSQWEVGTL
jgi:hypothetical protein